MTKTPSATLSTGIVKKPATVEKGMAAPSSDIVNAPSETLQVTETVEVPTVPTPAKKEKLDKATPGELLAMKNISVKVDIVTYTKLKTHGGEMGGKTNQAIFTEALALYFSKNGI